ncbi:MAG: 16S rRNA (cytidine(1402)-2'-O)-methyltransferase [Clostridia bacterium]|nr:16S rRNA (cytidine(1402)-2'-O)-methyltransferase [Clostridia bacterium]
MGRLYIVATPIGNLDDITLRAIQVLQSVDLIAAEDTRHTLKLLNHLEISKPLISCHRHNEEIKTEILIEKLREGQNIALVSDAGTPGICDPGEVVIRKCIEEGIETIPIPGACAMINAIITSGLDTKEFTFLGFLPLNKKLRKEKLEEIRKAKKTIILYEAPHKLIVTLKDLAEILEDRKVVLARELTKIHEEFIRGNINEIIQKAENLKGEMVLMIEGNKVIEEENHFENLSIEEHYKWYEQQGMEKKEIIKKMAKDRGTSKNEIYQKFI